MDFEDGADSFSVDGKRVAVHGNAKIADTDWASHGVDVVCCCTVSLPVIPLVPFIGVATVAAHARYVRTKVRLQVGGKCRQWNTPPLFYGSICRSLSLLV